MNFCLSWLLFTVITLTSWPRRRFCDIFFNAQWPEYMLQTTFSKSREIPRKVGSHHGPSTHLSSDSRVVNTSLDQTVSVYPQWSLGVRYVRILVRNNQPEMIDIMWRAAWHYDNGSRIWYEFNRQPLRLYRTFKVRYKRNTRQKGHACKNKMDSTRKNSDVFSDIIGSFVKILLFCIRFECYDIFFITNDNSNSLKEKLNL